MYWALGLYAESTMGQTIYTDDIEIWSLPSFSTND